MIEKPETAEFTAPQDPPAPEPAPSEAPPAPSEPTEPAAPSANDAPDQHVANVLPEWFEKRLASMEARISALEALSSPTEPAADEPPIGGPTSGFWECLNPKCSNARPSALADPMLFAGPTQSAAREAVTCPTCGGGQVIYAHDAPTEEGGKE